LPTNSRSYFSKFISPIVICLVHYHFLFHQLSSEKFKNGISQGGMHCGKYGCESSMMHLKNLKNAYSVLLNKS